MNIKPMSTDEFIDKILNNENLDHCDIYDAIVDWYNGDYSLALSYIEED